MTGDSINLPGETLGFMFKQTTIFVLVWACLNIYMAQRDGCPIPFMKTVVKYNSIFYSVANIFLLFNILSPSLDHLGRRLYHTSKFYEYVDVLNVRGSGGEIDLHFAIHHLTTPYLTYFRVMQHSEGWRYGAALNAFHHVLMYAYFGGFSTVRPLLPVTGTVQLIVGLTVESWIIRKRMRGSDEPVWPNVMAICLGLVFLVLFLRDLRHRAKKGVPEKEKQGV